MATTGFGLWARRLWYDRHYAQPSFNSDQAVSYAAESPNGRLRAEILFEAAGGGAPRWRVQHRGRAVLEPGSLGLTLADGRQLGPGARIIGQQLTRLDETLQPPYGVASEYAGACNELAVQLMDAATGIIFDILVRAYDAGVALRYLIRYIPDSETLHCPARTRTSNYLQKPVCMRVVTRASIRWCRRRNSRRYRTRRWPPVAMPVPWRICR